MMSERGVACTRSAVDGKLNRLICIWLSYVVVVFCPVLGRRLAESILR